MRGLDRAAGRCLPRAAELAPALATGLCAGASRAVPTAAAACAGFAAAGERPPVPPVLPWPQADRVKGVPEQLLPRNASAPEYIHPSLIDSFGRKHRYLRLSLTDKCNLRCQYCAPEEGDEPAEPASDGATLTSAEISRLLRIFVAMGVRKIRLTGGEPTIRGDFGSIVQDLGELVRQTEQPLSLGITTNGVRLHRFLPQLADARLTNINLSLDTLVAAKFPMIVRREPKWHKRVMDGLHEMLVEGSPFNVKLNCVVVRGINEDELGSFVDLVEKLPVEVRFLEFMPFVGNAWSEKRLFSQAEILAAVERHLAGRGLPLRKLPPDSPNDVARLFAVDGWRGRLGVIGSMTDAFCGGCNRLRITAHGEMRNCLFGEQGWSLRDSLRTKPSDQAVAEIIASGVQAKFAKLGGKRDMHELRERGALALPMMSLGG